MIGWLGGLVRAVRWSRPHGHRPVPLSDRGDQARDDVGRMALRVTQTTARALEAQAKRSVRVSGARFFSADAKKEEEEAAAKEEALMAQLKKQVLDESQRTILPFHASNAVSPAVNVDPITDPKEVALVSGVDTWAFGRKVKLFMPTRHQMQSGTYNTRHWELRFDAPRTWSNPLMGWTSTAEPMHGMVLKFDRPEDAIHFAEKQGWEVEQHEPAEVGNFEGEISYSHNFLPLHVENYIKKHGKKAHVLFKHPTGRRSNWVKTLKYHGNGVVAQHGGEAKEQ